jgi:outer membrane lipase/esterase
MMSKLKFAGRAKHAAAACALLLLGACGGGTQVEKFVPTRVLAFGDESSVIDDSGGRTGNGLKHTVNGYGADNLTLDCRVNPIWVQYVAGLWGLVFPQCNPTAVATTSQIYAAAGAKVAQLEAQITAAGPLGPKDLATVMIGANDLFELYVASPTVANEDAARALASTLAGQIARIVKTGARVVFVTVPNLGQTPYALQENGLNPGRAAVLTALTAAFNARLRTAISTASSPFFVDGHQGVQVLADELFESVVAQATTTPSATAYLNVTGGICTTTLVIDCTSNTLDPAATATTVGGTPFNYLWADTKHLSPGGQGTLGNSARARTVANPL